jgi:nucleotidyltransferase substrate binding protein (TIGR01987 family)
VKSLKNLAKALASLEKSVRSPVTEPRDISGIIKDFELVYELSWKTLKTFLEEHGHEVTSAKNAFSKAFQLGFISDEEAWLQVLKDRNQTVHTYDEGFAKLMCDRIMNSHLFIFQKLFKILQKN